MNHTPITPLLPSFFRRNRVSEVMLIYFLKRKLSWWMICCFLLFTKSILIAQDFQFSQFYAAPLYLNPAFAGANEFTRVGINYRNQWPGLEYSFNSYSMYIDHYSYPYNSGLGLIVNGSRIGLANLRSDEIGLVYSYHLHLSEDINFRAGGQVSYVTRNADFDEFIFGSKINIDDNSPPIKMPPPTGVLSDFRNNFFDYAIGGVITSNKSWFGASLHHMTEPNTTFVQDKISRLPLKISFHGGFKFLLPSGRIINPITNQLQERSISFAYNYKQQDPFNQLDIGTQLFLDPLVIGVWYRGLPMKYSLPNNEALIGIVGLNLPSGLGFGYSYDFTISKLRLRNSAGAHEVSLRYYFLTSTPNQRNKKARVNPCFIY
jgi:type IX secretion system PorP/SprF family membrane protein